jgi:Ca-activated chloride channel family protein
MKIDANDPRWTAYALGELKDDHERAELENILRESEEMRLMVEDIRQAAAWLNDGLKSESSAGLTRTQRDRIETQATKRRNWFWARPVWAFSGATAVLALLVLSVWVYRLQNGETVSQSSGTLIADLRNDRSPAAETVPSDADKYATKVEIAPVSVTVAGKAEDAKVETERARAAGLSERIEVSAPAQDLMAESSASTGTALDSKESAGLPIADNLEEMDLVGITGGARKDQSFAGVNANAIHIQQDGVTVSDIRYKTDVAASGRINSEKVGEFKAILSPVDAEQGRGSGQAQVNAKSGENEEVVDAIKPGEGAAYGSGGGVVSGVAGGVAGGFTGGISGFVPSEIPLIAPPPPGSGGGMGTGRGWGTPPPPPGSRRPREEERIYPPRPPADFNTEGYDSVVDNPFMEVTQNPLSTFSIDVDTASYANVRRYLDRSALPPKDAVRIEELINYFDYDYKGPGREGPFAAHFEMTEAPWNSEHRLLRIGIKAREMKGRERPPTNLVFLVDVSGSMADHNKLPLVQDALRLLVDRLTESDHVSIVTYAGSTRVELPSTRGDQKWIIYRAIDQLRSGGSTNGASGIELAYETAQRNFIEGGANRVILATDGDFNVGVTNHGDLARLIEEKADGGVFLSALGFGMGNLKDDTLELLATKGRGNYAYIDTINEARKVLVEQINATLIGVAKDVKIQVEFNPGRVGAYRLIGYEDRILAKEDFNNDAKKAGVIGAGHAVTALYEIVPAGKPIPSPGVDPLKYQKPLEPTKATSSDETATVKIRYKEPEEERSQLMSFAVRDSDENFRKASRDFKFAASVAAFGMVLRDSPYRGNVTLEQVLEWAKEGQGEDRSGYRGEYIRLLHRAMSLKY